MSSNGENAVQITKAPMNAAAKKSRATMTMAMATMETATPKR